MKEFFSKHGRTIAETIGVIVLSLAMAAATVYAILVGYFKVEPQDATTFTVDKVVFVDATGENDSEVHGFKLTDGKTNITYLITDEWDPIELTDAEPGAND